MLPLISLPPLVLFCCRLFSQPLGRFRLQLRSLIPQLLLLHAFILLQLLFL